MPGGRPKGSTSSLAARASRRNLQGRKATTTTTKGKDLVILNRWERIADRREKARLAREEAQAIREQARARLELGELCERSEAIAEVSRMQRIVRAELDRALAYLDPGLTPEVRQAAEAALGTTIRKLRTSMADQVEGKSHGR